MSSADNMERFAAKAALRTRIKIALKQLQCSERTRQSKEVTKQVLAHPKYASSRGIAVFLSMNDEIDTSNIVRDIFDSGKHCFIPRLVNFENIFRIPNLLY
jgi:5-formyltetrahydrofolate cyclo-ligase